MKVRTENISLSPSVTVSSFGRGVRHENRMPYQGVCYWVRTQ
nr:MAG TPA: Baseplate structural protein [Caudoviricetes sp.]